MPLDYNALMTNPLFQSGLGLLGASGPSTMSTGQRISQGLLGGAQNLQQAQMYQKQMEEIARKKAEQEAQQQFYRTAQQKYAPTAQQQALGTLGGPSIAAAQAVPTLQDQPLDVSGMYKGMLGVPGMGPTALAGLAGISETEEARKARLQELQMKAEEGRATRQEQAELRREIAQMGIEGRKAIAEMSKAGMGTPYFSPVQTAQGVMSFNARTGRMEPAVVSGAPVIGSTSDPELQRRLAGAKAGGKVTGEAQAEAAISLPQDIQEASDTIGLIDDLLKHPGFGQAVGKSSMLGIQKIPGTEARAFMTRLNQLRGKQFLQAFQSLKGGGQITEIEGQKATEAMSRMDNSSTETEFIKASREFQDVIRKGVERAKKRAAQPATVPQAIVPQGATHSGINPATGQMEYFDAQGNRVQ